MKYKLSLFFAAFATVCFSQVGTDTTVVISVAGVERQLTQTQFFNANELLTRLTATCWRLGAQTLTATSAIGSTSAHGVNLTTNGTARIQLDATGGVRSGTITDLVATASDSIALNSAGPDLQLVSGFARIVDSGGTVRYNMNNSTGATAVTLPDNTTTAGNFSISGGSDMLVFNTTNGAEKVIIGGGTSGSTVQVSADTLKLNTGLITDGTYTPTLTNTTNIGASTAYVCSYLRVGNTVTISGRVDVDAIATGTVMLEMSLPFASDFTAIEQAGGTAASTINTAAPIYADIADNRLNMVYTATVTTNEAFHFSVTYRIL